jgi:hypothetical protein
VDPTFLLLIAAIVAVLGIGIGVAARRGGGDRAGDRGPYSSSTQARSDFAAFGADLERRAAPPDADDNKEDG